MAKKQKYYFDRNGKRISKAEGERREKISRSLKARNKEKKRARVKELKRNNARVIDRTLKKSSRKAKRVPLVSFTVRKKRAKVKTFAKKDSDRFYFAEKRYYELDVPIAIDSPETAKKAIELVEEIRQPLLDDFSQSQVKDRLINIGYDISITFKSKNGKEETTIQKPCYVPSFVASDANAANKSITLLKEDIQQRFLKYFTKTGFDGLAIFGFETEISKGSVFDD